MKNSTKLFGVLLIIIAISVGIIMTVSNNNTLNNDHSSDEKMVITSFYPIHILAMNVLKDVDGIKLNNLSEPKTGCLHDYQLTPDDMKLLSDADIFIVNGGGIESFLTEIVTQYSDLELIEASGELNLTENGHAWMSMYRYKMMVQTIAAKMSILDEKNSEQYENNALKYCEKIDTLIENLETHRDKLKDLKVGILHEGFEYLVEDYEMNLLFTLDMHEEEHSSAGEIKDVVNIIKEHEIRVVFAEEESGKEIGDIIEKETDCKVYYLNPHVFGEYDPNGYLDSMKQNMDILNTIG